RQGPYFVLALSEKLRRLLRADGARTREIELRGAPRDVEDANRFDDPERYIGFHTRTPGGSPGGERRPAMFHGHGAARDAANAERQQYARLIARSVYREIGSESAPLVLVGSEQMVSAFRSFNEYPHLVDDDVITSPDLLSDDELRERAWPAVAPIFERERRDLIERFHQSLGTGLASDRIGEIISAAHQGRVGAVIVTERAAPRGRVDLDTGDARFVSHKNTEGADLVDYAVVLTLKNRGRVLWATTEEARIDAPIVAIYRY
ncbi:MAG TPA: hypothetical protein VK116_09650, partial [Planctomycetota bacterium]|nr:hypothetical protein [Planctomycetota bacterium]